MKPLLSYLLKADWWTIYFMNSLLLWSDNRTIRETRSNLPSSRAHTILTVMLQSRPAIANENFDEHPVRVSSLVSSGGCGTDNCLITEKGVYYTTCNQASDPIYGLFLEPFIQTVYPHNMFYSWKWPKAHIACCQKVLGGK